MTSNKNRIDEGETVENSCWLKRISSVEMQTSARWCKRNGCQQMTSVVPGEERSLHGYKWVEQPAHRRQEKTGEDAGIKHVAGILWTFYVVPFSQGIQSTKGAKNTTKEGQGRGCTPHFWAWLTLSWLPPLWQAQPLLSPSICWEGRKDTERERGGAARIKVGPGLAFFRSLALRLYSLPHWHCIAWYSMCDSQNSRNDIP